MEGGLELSVGCFSVSILSALVLVALDTVTCWSALVVLLVAVSLLLVAVSLLLVAVSLLLVAVNALCALCAHSLTDCSLCSLSGFLSIPGCASTSVLLVAGIVRPRENQKREPKKRG